MEKEKRSRLPLFGNFRRRASGEKGDKQPEGSTSKNVATSHGSPSRRGIGSEAVPSSPKSPRVRHKSGSPFRSVSAPGTTCSLEQAKKKSSTLPVAKTERILYNGSGHSSGNITSRSLPSFMHSPNMPRHRAPGLPSGLVSPVAARRAQVMAPRVASGQSLADGDLAENDYAEIWDNDDDDEEDIAENSKMTAGEQRSWSRSPAHCRVQPSMTGEMTPLDMGRRYKSSVVCNKVDSLGHNGPSLTSSSGESAGRQGYRNNNANSSTSIPAAALPSPPVANCVNLGDNGPSFGERRPLPSPPRQEDVADTVSPRVTPTGGMTEDLQGSGRGSSPVSRLGMGRAYNRPTCGIRMRELKVATKRQHCISPPTIEEEEAVMDLSQGVQHNPSTTRSPSLDPHIQRAYSYPEESLEPERPSRGVSAPRPSGCRLGHPPTPTSPRRNIYGSQRHSNQGIQQHMSLSDSRGYQHKMSPASTRKGAAMKSKSGSTDMGQIATIDGKRPKEGDLELSMELSDSEIEMSSYGLADSIGRQGSGGYRHHKVNCATSTAVREGPEIPQRGQTGSTLRYDRHDTSARDGTLHYTYTGMHTQAFSNTPLHTAQQSQSISTGHIQHQSDTVTVTGDSKVITSDTASPGNMSAKGKCDASAQTATRSVTVANPANRKYRTGLAGPSRLRPPASLQGGQECKDDAAISPAYPPAGGTDQRLPTHTGRLAHTYGRQLARPGPGARHSHRPGTNSTISQEHSFLQISEQNIDRPVLRKNGKKSCGERFNSGSNGAKPNANRNMSSQVQHRVHTKDVERPYNRKPRHSNLEKKYTKGCSMGPAYKKAFMKGHASDTEEYSGSCESSTEDLTKLGKYAPKRQGSRSKSHSTSPHRNNDLELSSSLSSSVSSVASTSSGTTSLPSPSRGQQDASKDNDNKNNVIKSAVALVTNKDNDSMAITHGDMTRKLSGTETRTSDTGYSDSSYNGYNRESTPETGFTSPIEEATVCVQTAIKRTISQEGNDTSRRASGLARANSAPTAKSSIPKSQVPQLPRRTHSLGAQRPSGSKIGLPKSSINVSQREKSGCEMTGKGKMAAGATPQRQATRSHIQPSTPPVSPRPQRSKVMPYSSSSPPSQYSKTSSSLTHPSRITSRSKLDNSASRSNLARAASKTKLISASRSNLAQASSKQNMNHASSKTNLSPKYKVNQGHKNTKSKLSESKSDISPSHNRPSSQPGPQYTVHKSTTGMSTAANNQKLSGLRKPNTSPNARREGMSQTSGRNDLPSRIYQKSLSRESSVDSTADKEESPHRKKSSSQKPPLPPRSSSLKGTSHSEKDNLRCESVSPPQVSTKPSLSRLSKIKPPGSRLPFTTEQKSISPSQLKTTYTSTQMVSPASTVCELGEMHSPQQTCVVVGAQQTAEKGQHDKLMLKDEPSHMITGSRVQGLSTFGSQSRLRKPYNTGRYSNVTAAHNNNSNMWCTKQNTQISHSHSHSNAETVSKNESMILDVFNSTSCSSQDKRSTSDCDNVPSSNNYVKISHLSSTGSSIGDKPHSYVNICTETMKITSAKTIAGSEQNVLDSKDNSDSYTACYDGDNIMVVECQQKEISSVLDNTLSEVTKKDQQRGLKLSENTKEIKTEERDVSAILHKDKTEQEEDCEGIEIETIEVRSIVEVYHKGNVVSRKLSNGQQSLSEATENNGECDDRNQDEGTIEERRDEVSQDIDLVNEKERLDKQEEFHSSVESETHNSLEGETSQHLDGTRKQLDAETHADSPVCDSGIMSESSEESNHAGSDDGQKSSRHVERNSFDSGDTRSLFSGSDEGVAPALLSISSTLDENRNLAAEGKTETELVEEYISKSGLLDSDQSESDDNGGHTDGTLNGSDEDRRKGLVSIVSPPMEVCSAATTPETEHGKSFPGHEELKHCCSLDGKLFTKQARTNDKHAVNLEYIMKHGLSLDSAKQRLPKVLKEDDNDNVNKSESDETIKADDEYQLELLSDMCEEYISVTRIPHGRTYTLNNSDSSKIDSCQLKQPTQIIESSSPDIHDIQENAITGIFGQAKRNRGKNHIRKIMPRSGDKSDQSDKRESTTMNDNLSIDKKEDKQVDDKETDVTVNHKDISIKTQLSDNAESYEITQSKHIEEHDRSGMQLEERKRKISLFLSDDDMLNDTADEIDKPGFFISPDPYEDLCDENLESFNEKVLDRSYDMLDEPDSPKGNEQVAENQDVLVPGFGSPSNGPTPMRCSSSPNLQKGRRQSETDAECLLAGGSPLKRTAATSHLNVVDVEDDDTILIVDVTTCSRKLVSQSAVSENSLFTNVKFQEESDLKGGDESPVDPAREKEVTEAAAKLREFLESSISESTSTDSDDSARGRKNIDTVPETKLDTCENKSQAEVALDVKDKTKAERIKSPLKVDVEKACKRQVSPKSPSHKSPQSSIPTKSPQSPSHKSASPKSEAEVSPKCRIPKPRAFSSRIPTVGERHAKEGDTRVIPSSTVADAVRMFTKNPCTVDVSVSKQRDSLTSPRIDEGYGTLRGSEKLREGTQRTSWE